MRKNRAKITKRQISRATISCTNHIPAYPRPANHVAVCQSPPAVHCLAGRAAKTTSVFLSIDVEGCYTNWEAIKSLVLRINRDIMNAEKPVEEMDVREVFILIEKHFNTEVAEKFEGTFNKCQNRFVDFVTESYTCILQ